MNGSTEETALRGVVISSAMGALALALPVAFHAAGLGSEFLPMLLPLLVNAFLAPLLPAAATALAIPFISALATGMPPLFPPVAAVLAAEALVMTFVVHLLRRRRPLWVPLISAIAAGRLTAVALTWYLAPQFDLPSGAAGFAILVQGLPGTLLQLAVVPAALRVVRRRRGLLSPDGMV